MQSSFQTITAKYKCGNIYNTQDDTVGFVFQDESVPLLKDEGDGDGCSGKKELCVGSAALRIG